MSSESYVPIVPFNKQLTDVCDAQPAATVLELGESYDARMLWQVLQSIQSRQDNCEILLKVYGSIVRRLQMMAVSTRKEKSTNVTYKWAPEDIGIRARRYARGPACQNLGRKVEEVTGWAADGGNCLGLGSNLVKVQLKQDTGVMVFMLLRSLQRSPRLFLHSSRHCSTSVPGSVNRVFELFDRHGKGDYIGEDVSQLEHALQAADLAHRSGHGLEATLAALLHDVGHLLGMEDKSHARMGDCGIANHENLGGEWLAGLGFSPKVCKLVSRHVDAKRYLCAVNQEYHDTLSSASKTTLIHQGGPMTQEEAKAFEKEELFKVILAMRRWDEAAKVKGKKVPELEAYRDMMVQNDEPPAVATALQATREKHRFEDSGLRHSLSVFLPESNLGKERRSRTEVALDAGLARVHSDTSILEQLISERSDRTRAFGGGAGAAVVNALSTVVGGHDHLTAHKGQAPQVPRLGPILLIFGTMGCRALWFRVLIQGLRF
ncbi:phnZ [Symbiodinium sp. KB8]|nr:phnZ [Symbiodinium sp. KB8]